MPLGIFIRSSPSDDVVPLPICKIHCANFAIYFFFISLSVMQVNRMFFVSSKI
jgi:hypothetical protein